jgi:hypothetical protein
LRRLIVAQIRFTVLPILVVSVAICDVVCFSELYELLEGPLQSLESLNRIERIVRAVVLHDKTQVCPTPVSPQVLSRQNDQSRSLCLLPDDKALCAFDFLELVEYPRIAPGSQLPQRRADLVEQFFSDNTVAPPLPLPGTALASVPLSLLGDPGATDFYIRRLFGAMLEGAMSLVEAGGSALLSGKFFEQVFDAAMVFPESLFQNLDRQWVVYARQMQEQGLKLVVPPVLGIVLTRCGRRDAIPYVIRDLRNEWEGARKKVWQSLAAMKGTRTIGEALEIERHLSEISALFVPEPSEHDSRPVRVLWELAAGAAAGGALATAPATGAAVGAMNQVPRSIPGLFQEFGPSIFRRGGFDLAHRVKRAVLDIEIDSLRRLLSDAEKQSLGLQ